MNGGPHDAAAPPPGRQGGGPSALVELRPLGVVSEITCAVAAANLQAIMGLRVKVAEPLSAPESCFMPVRRQYDAGLLLGFLSGVDSAAPIRLGLLEKDMSLPIFTHVFGEALLGSGSAVVSLFRLRARAENIKPSRELVYQRLAKVACHEVGHSMGLGHCARSSCLMAFAGGLEQLDGIPLGFCPACGKELAHRRGLLEEAAAIR